jgi:hypothetical protein
MCDILATCATRIRAVPGNVDVVLLLLVKNERGAPILITVASDGWRCCLAPGQANRGR